MLWKVRPNDQRVGAKASRASRTPWRGSISIVGVAVVPGRAVVKAKPWAAYGRP